MGLLDDLLGQLGGGARTEQRPQPQTAPAGGNMDMGRILMALLPVVLSMLAQRGQQGGGARGGVPGTGGTGGGGGMGGGLGEILGGILGGGRAGAGSSGTGGLGGLLEQLQRAGFGRQAQSWVSAGPNEAIPPEALESIFGPDGLGEVARRAGLTEQETALGLSQLLPEVVDRVTPGGAVPEQNVLSASVEAMIRRMNEPGGADGDAGVPKL
jgi:uncharacterized protein YidB (DUF937 family)